MCDNCCAPFIEGEGCSSALQKRASNVASGDYSLATGHGTIASNEGEFSAGTYNKPNTNQIFSVGIGTSDSDRKNAIQINKDGSIYFLYNGQSVELTNLIKHVSPGSNMVIGVSDGYIRVSYDNGATWENLIALSELQGPEGKPGKDGSDYVLPVASNDELGGIKTGYVENGDNHAVKVASDGKAYVTVAGGGGGGEGTPGRSITGTQQWFKLSDSLAVSAPALSIADPSSSEGGSWVTSHLIPTEQLPYLWTFIQYNYDQPLSTGYTYSRSSAWKVSSYNVDPSQEYQDLQDSIAGIYSELRADIDAYGVDLQNLSSSLSSLRSSVEGTITNELNRLTARLASIDASEVKIIEDDGLWALMTSWASQDGAKKAFADIIADAQKAKIILDAGSTFFGANGHVGMTLDGIQSRFDLTATKSYVDSSIASAQFSVDPAALQSVIAKGQQAWEKDGALYPYNLHITDGSGFDNLVDYEEYMSKSEDQGGPSADSHGPAGPFELVVIVNQLSSVKQTAESISSEIGKIKYMWQNGNNFYEYDDPDITYSYEHRDSRYSDYSYDQYVQEVLGYSKVETSDIISGIKQTSTEMQSIVGEVNKIWRKANNDGTYQYERYAVPANRTRDQYVSQMEDDGWSLIDYSDKFSVLDQTAENVTIAVAKSFYVWINDSATSTEDYCKPYDEWLDDYKSSSYTDTYTYEQYVSQFHNEYELIQLNDAFARIKVESDRITSAVSDIDMLDTSVSQVRQTARDLTLSVANINKAWVDDTTGEVYGYEDFRSAYESAQSSETYEAWVTNNRNCTLTEVTDEISGIKVQSDKIWAGVKNGNDVAASISILANSSVDPDTGSKIILDATNVEIRGGLAAGVVTASNIAAGALTTDKLLTTGASGTLNILAQNGLLGIYLGAIDESNLTTNRRAAFGIENGDVVLKFYDANGNELYNLGPGGIFNLSGPLVPPTWTKLKFYYSSTEFAAGDVLSSSNSVDIYRYEDAYRVIGSAIQRLSPFNINSTISGTSEMHDKYFSQYLQSPTQSTYSNYFATPGYYIIDHLMWNANGYGQADSSYSPSGSYDTDEGYIVLGFQVTSSGDIRDYETRTRIYKASAGSNYQYSVRKFEH